MKRTGLAMLVGLILLGASLAASAAEATRPGGARRGRPGAPPPPMQGVRPEIRQDVLEYLKDLPEGKAELERFQGVLKGIGEDRRKLAETIRKEVQGGKTHEQAVAAHEADIKALIKRRVDAAIEHRTKLLAIAKTNEDKLVDIIYNDIKEFREEHQDQIQERRQEMQERREQGSQAPPRRGGMRPGGGDAAKPPVPPPPSDDDGGGGEE